METNKPLHGLRGAAACTVVLGHYEIIAGAPSLVVILFFVLSGFLIGKLYLETDFAFRSVAAYLIARFARVYPLFAVVVVTIGGAGYFYPELNVFDISPLQIIRNLMLLGENLTIWTISTEFQFYLAFVAIWALRARLGSGPKVIIPLFLLSLIFALLWRVSESRTGLPGYLHIFTLGILVSMLPGDMLERMRALSRWLLPTFLLAYLVVFMTASKGVDIYLDPIAIIVCVGILVTSLSGGANLTNRVLSMGPAVWAGEISFGIYLLHRPAARIVQLAAPDLPFAGHQGAAIALTMTLAFLAFWLIEKPSRSFIRQRGNALLKPAEGTDPQGRAAPSA